uniref:ANK_REP_REGION domain-containing protein n=1 Tax=Macrostomum lignano TaxID=282301 RepID=A0A1I8FDJ9_9PLAT
AEFAKNHADREKRKSQRGAAFLSRCRSEQSAALTIFVTTLLHSSNSATLPAALTLSVLLFPQSQWESRKLGRGGRTSQQKQPQSEQAGGGRCPAGLSAELRPWTPWKSDLERFLKKELSHYDVIRVRRLATRQLVTSADAARPTVLMLVADAPETPVHTEKCILYSFELGDHLRLLTLLSFDAKWLRNDNGATPLMEAARTGSWKCAKHLLHLFRSEMLNGSCCGGCLSTFVLFGLKDREGRTASDLARLSGHSELASYIEREMGLGIDDDGSISGLGDQVSGICGADAAAAEQLCSNFPFPFAGGRSTGTAAAGRGGRLGGAAASGDPRQLRPA